MREPERHFLAILSQAQGWIPVTPSLIVKLKRKIGMGDQGRSRGLKDLVDSLVEIAKRRGWAEFYEEKGITYIRVTHAGQAAYGVSLRASWVSLRAS